jgi:hypothetical protein
VTGAVTVTTARTGSATADRPVSRTPAIGHGAVLRAIEKNTVTVVVPVLGTIRLPPADVLAWFGGLTTLAVLGIIEWPVATAVGAGHLLAHQHHLRLLHGLGEALEEA